MAKIENNTSNITGNENIVIQSCNLQNLTINNLDFAAFENSIKESIGNTVPINILILTAISENIKGNFSETDFDQLNSTHTLTQQNARKFFCGNQGILEILQEYQTKSGYAIKAYLIDSSTTKPERKLLNHLKLWRRDTILLCDTFSILPEYNKLIANLFDDSEIGGCLVCSCDKHSGDFQQKNTELIKTVFSTLCDYINSYADYLDNRQDEGFLHINLNITNKNTLFRTLSAIAAYHLQHKPNRRFRDLDHIEEVPLNLFLKK